MGAESTCWANCFPVELALPWRYLELWKPMEHRLDEVKAFFKESGPTILSIHATQGPISEDSFLDWGRKTLELARELGVRDVTLHPENRKTGRQYSSLNSFAPARISLARIPDIMHFLD